MLTYMYEHSFIHPHMHAQTHTNIAVNDIQLWDIVGYLVQRKSRYDYTCLWIFSYGKKAFGHQQVGNLFIVDLNYTRPWETVAHTDSTSILCECQKMICVHTRKDYQCTGLHVCLQSCLISIRFGISKINKVTISETSTGDDNREQTDPLAKLKSEENWS